MVQNGSNSLYVHIRNLQSKKFVDIFPPQCLRKIIEHLQLLLLARFIHITAESEITFMTTP